MRRLLLRILVSPTRGSSAGLARKRSTMFSVLLFLLVHPGRMSVGITYTATSPIRFACARTGEMLARNYVERPRCLQIPSSCGFLTAHPSRMTFGIGHALASRLGLLDHIQGRFLQETVAHALGALFLTSALPRSRPGSISQDVALLTHCYELCVHLTLSSSSMRTFRHIQKCQWLGAFLASIR